MRHWNTVGAIGLLLLAGCGGGVGLQDSDRAGTLQAVQASAANGLTGTVEGYLYLGRPGVPTPLRDKPVRLIPLAPAIEAVVAETHARYAAGGFQPLPAAVLARAHQPITAFLRQLQEGGHRELANAVRTASSGDPLFRFQDVPAGRWLLLAERHSAVSTILWAVPVTVSAGVTTRQSLSDFTIWIEGLRPSMPRRDTAP